MAHIFTSRQLKLSGNGPFTWVIRVNSCFGYSCILLTGLCIYTCPCPDYFSPRNQKCDAVISLVRTLQWLPSQFRWYLKSLQWITRPSVIFQNSHCLSLCSGYIVLDAVTVVLSGPLCYFFFCLVCFQIYTYIASLPLFACAEMSFIWKALFWPPFLN